MRYWADIVFWTVLLLAMCAAYLWLTTYLIVVPI